MFLLMYWDTYKNYYANKQEEIGYVINKSESLPAPSTNIHTLATGGTTYTSTNGMFETTTGYITIQKTGYIIATYPNANTTFYVNVLDRNTKRKTWKKAEDAGFVYTSTTGGNIRADYTKETSIDIVANGKEKAVLTLPENSLNI